MIEQDDESLYTGKVEIELGLSVDKDIMTKLFGYLSSTSGVKSLKTVGSSSDGVSVSMVLDEPLSLVEALSSRIPEAQVIGESLDENGKKQKVRRIRVAKSGA